jgi:hypothetical protein
MTYDPRKRDSTWTMIQPGCYLDPAGRSHLFPDEVIAYLQHAYPDAGFEMSDRAWVAKAFVEMLRKQFPDVEVHFIEHERLAS